MARTIRIDRVETSAEKIQIVNLLYEGDRQFVPITPLATLNASTTFLKADMDGKGDIRAASSSAEWLRGCDRATMEDDCTVYELASSVVRSPMGGFEAPCPSLQQIFTFARLIDILAPYIAPEDGRKHRISVIAAIAAENAESLAGMEGMGMADVASLPKWLDYEHRGWFPKIGKTRPKNEARYFWFPGDRVKAFMESVAPYVGGAREMQRKNRQDPTIIESYGIDIKLGEYSDLLGRFGGSLDEAVKNIPYDIFSPPPDLARLDKDYPGQPDSEVVF